MSGQEKPAVFISFNHKSRDFVDSLERKLSKVAEVIRYEDAVPAWGSFVQFMDTLKDQDFAVLVVSDAYLKSYACLYEVLQAMKNPDWKQRVLIALMPDARPYLDEERIRYIRYWKDQYEEISQKLEEVPREASPGLWEKRDRIQKIAESIDILLAFIADANCPPIYDVIGEICDRVSLSRKSLFVYTDKSGKKKNLRLVSVREYIRLYPGSSSLEIAEGLGISRRSAAYYILQLMEEGAVTSVKQGRKTLYYSA